jgi:hypothetical protein
MRHRWMALVGILGGCNRDITLEVASDRPIPQGIDSVCVAVADASSGGGHFGRLYRLEGKLATLPQSLRVEPGSADRALAWVRGDRGGVPAALAAQHVDFGSDVTIALDACVRGPAGAPQPVGAAVGPANARLAASEGQGGTLVVAAAAGEIDVVDARGGKLVITSAKLPAPPPGNPVALIAADLDGDCDDDLVIVTDGAPPELWWRKSDTFVDGGAIGTAPVSAVAAGDVDGDGHVDLVVGSGGTLALWRNDGAGNFAADPSALSGGGLVTAVSSLALGDLDGDGSPDLVVGQAGGPLAAWIGSSGGAFAPSTGVVPAVPLDVERLVLADADGDFDPDLAVAVRGGPMRLYIDRDGVLEDQTFVRAPAPPPPPTVHAIAFGGWDDGCPPDAVLASDAGTPSWRGQTGGAFAVDTTSSPPATDVVMVDIDDDGDLDAVFATAGGVQWLAR